MIHILNRFDEIIGFLSNENPETPVYWGGKHTEKLNSAANYYEFSTVTDHEYVQELTNMNKVVARHPDGYFIPFRIHRVTQRNKDGIREKVVEVEGEHMRLRTAKVLSPITLTSATLKTAARFILSGTGWQVGLIEFAGAKTIEFKDFTNALKALHQINELFGMEIRFRIVIQRNKVVGRYVDFLERVGEDNGKEIVLGKDLISVERIEDSNDVYTALIGIGKANEEGKFITFEGINGGKNYVEDQEAFQRWGDESGHHIGVYYVEPEEGEELTPEIVRERTKEALKRHIESVVQYKVTGASLEKVFDLDHEKVRKGDTVRIKDTGFTPPLYLEARVLETFRYDDPGKEDEFLLGNYQELKIKPNQILMDLQKQLFRNERKWSSAVRKVRSTLPPQDQTVIWIDTTEVPNIVKTYNESESTWEKASPTVAAEVGAETPEGAEAKANTAKSEAIAYMNTQLTNYVNATLYSDDISELQAQIDNQIQSHFKPYEPSLSNEPASDWRTDEEKRNHVGDLFYNTETGHSYRFALDGTNFKWLMVRDEGIAKALADAAQAQDTADSKRRTFVSQPNTPYDEGDLWDKDGAVFRSTVTKTKSASFSLSDWVKIGDVTSENKAKDTESVGGVPAEDIETKDGAAGKANQAKADAQTFTETYANKKVTQSTSPPETPSHDDLWIDISVNPYVWKRWDGETWKKATPTTADEVGAETPNGAQYKANQAKEDAVSIAKQDAAKKAVSAVSESRTFTEEFANKKISQGTSAPTDAFADDLWIDTSQTPYVWKRYTGSSWVKATPTTASEVGAETPAGAQAKANSARDAAISSAASDAESKATAAESAAKSYAEAQANAAQTAAQTHADGKVTAEEEARIQQAQTNLADAKKHADDAAEAAKTAAKNYAETAAESAGESSKAFTQEYAQKQVTQQSAAPSSPETNDLWIDTSQTPHIWKKWSGSSWIKMTSTTAAEVGAETPSGAQAKANAAKSSAISTASSDATSKANAAESAAKTYASNRFDGTKNLVSGWKYGSTTYIDGGNIYANSLTANAIAAKTITANELKAGIIDSDLIVTAGLDAGVIKFGTMSGSRIQVGTLNADRIGAGVIDARRVAIGSGTSFDSGFDPSTKETPSGAQTKANAAKSSAISAAASDATSKANAAESAAKKHADDTYSSTKSLVDGWKYGSTTYINGGDVYTNTITANQIASKTITANQLKAGIIDSDLIVTAGLDAGVIKFGTMDGKRIAAKSITTDELNVLARNLVNNFSVTGDLAGWSSSSSKGSSSSVSVYGGSIIKDADRGNVLKIARSSKTYYFSEWFEVDPTQDYKVSLGVKVPNNIERVYFGIETYDEDGHQVGTQTYSGNTWTSDYNSNAYFWNSGDQQDLSEWRDMYGHVMGMNADPEDTPEGKNVSSQFRFHPKTKYLQIRFLHYMDGSESFWYSPSVAAVSGGQITTNQITAGGLNANVIRFGTMHGDRIDVRTLNGNRIETNTIDSNHIVTSGLNANVIKFGSMDGDRIATNSLHANRIQSKTIDSDLIVTAGLDAGVIKFGTMHGNRISANTLDGNRITGNSVHGDKITAGTLNANRLEANSVIADNITFTGQLEGATGTFSGDVSIAELLVRNPSIRSTGTTDLHLATGYQSSTAGLYNEDGVITLSSFNRSLAIYRLDSTKRTAALNVVSMMADDVTTTGNFHADGSINANTNLTAPTANVTGEIRAGSINTTVIELQKGDKNIVLSDSNPDFHGYGMGATVDFYGDGTRNNSLLYAAGIEVFQALGLVNGKMYGENDAYFRFGDDGSNYKHHVIQFGQAKLKSLNSSQSTIQARNLADDEYVKITASDFQVGSLRSYKKNIEPYMGKALQKVVGTQVYHYHLNSDDDRELKRVGLIYEESDADVVDPSGDGMSSYSMTAVLWKAVQELNSKIIDLQNKIA